MQKPEYSKFQHIWGDAIKKIINGKGVVGP